MKSTIALTAMIFGIALSACTSVDTASRAAQLTGSDFGAVTRNASAMVAEAGPVVLHSMYDVEAIRIAVLPRLKVSEANMFRPVADIVWRGEPLGDRHAQVAVIFNEAASQSTANMVEGPQVIVVVEVTRFHALTEKTRYTVGGVHSIKFILTVRDAQSGAVIDGPRTVVADVKASGGAKALAEDQAGRTQRVVIVERLAEVLRRELSGPVSAVPADLVSRMESSPVALPSVLAR